MLEKKNDFLCYVCMFILVVVLTLILIGEEDEPQKVEIVNTQRR